ncbi:MAG: hypothetical protein JXA13_07555 [Anaerolineales bacterium]|nr:hypothetical protein [Anaerolineales bacterium]
MPTEEIPKLLRENAWQLTMYALGTALVAIVSCPLAILYLALSLASNIAYMAIVCPYCGHYGLGTCKAGFHLLSGGNFKPAPGKTFVQQFPIGAGIVGVGWFIPLIFAWISFMRGFSWLAAILLLAFLIVAFWILPKDSQRHCAECEMLDCPRYPKK